MKRVKTHYDQAFRDKAIQLALNSSKPFSQTAKDLGIKATTLYQWLQRHQGKDAKPEPTNTDVYAELIRLKKEVALLKEEREILKKAALSSNGHCNILLIPVNMGGMLDGFKRPFQRFFN